MSMGEPCVPGCAVGVYCTGQCLVVPCLSPRVGINRVEASVAVRSGGGVMGIIMEVFHQVFYGSP